MSTPNSTPTLPSDELGEPIDGEPMIDKHTGKKILRPRNAWILYRNSRLDDVPSLSDGSRQPMADASKIISSWWKTESADVKYKFELEAEKEKEEHKRKYPNYRFQPMSKAQKAQKKAESRERAKQAQQLKRKTKTRKTPPLQPYTSSTHTSYLAAAVANQAQQLGQPLAVATYGAEGPSPPMSLASTPATTPSSFPSSDFEQGSSTSATSAHTTSSPSDALGLGLPSRLNFDGQEEARARVPRRAPIRLPPRHKAPKVRSGTPISPRDTSSSSITARALSPATTAHTALSPLPWPLPSQDAHEQPPSHYSTDSPTSAIDPSAVAATQSWYHHQLFDNAAPDTTTIDLDFTIPDSYSEEFFNNLAEGGDPIIPEGTGIFSLPMDEWNGPPPDQFHVSLDSSDATTPISPEDEQQFNTFLSVFLASGDHSLQNTSSSTAVPQPVPQMVPVSEATNDHDEWRNWVVGAETSQEEIPTSTLLADGNDLPAFDPADIDMSMTQGPTPPADYYEPQSSLQHESSPCPPAPAHQQQQGPPVDDSLPAHLAADPTFLHFYNQYLAHKQSTQLLESTRQPTQSFALHPQQQQRHSEPQYASQEQLQYGSPTEPQPASRQPSYVIHSRQASVAVPLSPALSGDSSDSPHSTSYSPPSGAATTVGVRRVAAMWKRPVSPSKQGVVPQWNPVASS